MLAVIPSQRRRESGSDVAGVEGACYGGILGAFENGAAVGEDGHLVRVDAKTEQEFVVADIGDGGRKPLLQRSQIESTAPAREFGRSLGRIG